MDSNISRRELLQLSVAGIGISTVAGCISDQGGTGDGSNDSSDSNTQTESETSSDGGTENTDKKETKSSDKSKSSETKLGKGDPINSDYTKWLPKPPSMIGKGYNFRYLNIKTLRKNKRYGNEKYKQKVAQTVTPQRDLLGLDVDQVDEAVVVWRNFAVLSGKNFGDKGVIDTLKKKGYEKSTEYKGYILYRKPDKGIVAVSKTTLVLGTTRRGMDNGKVSELTKKFIDTAKGDAETDLKNNKKMKTLVEKVGKGTAVLGSTAPVSESMTRLRGTEARGMNMSISGEKTDLKMVLFLDTKQKQEVKSEAKNYMNKFLGVNMEKASVTDKDGKLIIDTKVKTENLYSGSGDYSVSEGSVPQVRFGFSQKGKPGEQGSKVKITHKGGDNIDNTDGESLKVTVNGKPTQNQFPAKEIVAGDSITVDISEYSSGDVIEVIWINDSGETDILQDYELE